MDSYTIAETYTLPSKGLLYKDVPELVTIRTMTTEEEMRRLSQLDTTYKKLCDILDKCILEDLPISTYDMCLGDYQGLLYKLRTVSYGPECLNPTICPKCNSINLTKVNLDELAPIKFNGFNDNDFIVDLPKSKTTITLRYQTPRLLDLIEKDVEDFQERNKENQLDLNLLFTLKNSIKYINGESLDPIKKELFIRKLPIADTNKLLKAIIKLNDKVGVNIEIIAKCDNPECGFEYGAKFRINSEFFGPTID